MDTDELIIAKKLARNRQVDLLDWAFKLAIVLLLVNLAFLELPNQIFPENPIGQTTIIYYFAAVLCLTHAFFVSVMTIGAYEIQLGRKPKFKAVTRFAIRRFWILGFAWIALSGLTIYLTGNGLFSIPVIWIVTAFPLLAPITQIECLGPVATLQRSAQLISQRCGRLILILVPTFALIEFLGYPLQTCTGECWGLLEGGAVSWPLLGLHMFLASYLGAVLSARIYASAIADENPTDK